MGLYNRLFFLFFVSFFVAEVVVATTTMADGKSGKLGLRPGFIYTRNRGRCTPQFWSSRRESWPKMIPQTSSVSKVFGSRALERFKYDLTLLEATQRNDDGNNAFSRLLKQSTAALLNSYNRKGYPYSSWEVKTLLIQALVSEEAAALQAQPIKKATIRLNSTLAAVLNRKTKKRVISLSSVLHPHKLHKHHNHKLKFSPVYVDDLFTTESISVQASTAAAARGKVIEKPPESSTAAAAAMTVYVPPKGDSGQTLMEVPQLQGVDERAEEFIAKFKEDMRLQRQKSFGEYQEMLARGL
ncbi:hypothetical protein NE237_012114 [Protea cynaroides]|uniref:Uncharacterized protein n=1 Tax=Protea cynaroides TaxID=273540 RepID=A0A9Q0GYI1_9MAGN|nr:hypothetical protein NE237_012114 [Protea cynaroides]